MYMFQRNKLNKECLLDSKILNECFFIEHIPQPTKKKILKRRYRENASRLEATLDKEQTFI